MQHDYSLAHLTVLTLEPPVMVDAAADAGYRYVGFRLVRTTPGERHHPLITDPDLMARTRDRMAARRIDVLDVEVARLEPDVEPESLKDFLRTGAELGATNVIAQAPDPEQDRAIDRFGRLCDLAAPLGLNVSLEFVSWTEVPDLSTAARFVRAVARPNAGILVDLIHFDRSDSSIDRLRSLPREWFRFVHVTDAPAERPTTVAGLIHGARSARLCPGDGGIDVRGILGALPSDIPYALEIPGSDLSHRVGPLEYARRAIARSREHLDDGQP